MFVTTSHFIILALFLQMFQNLQCKVIKFEEIPFKSGELTLKFVPNKDPSSEDLGKILLMLRDDRPAPKVESGKAVPDSTPVPDLVNKFGIAAGKCPSGYKWIGIACVKN
ncbi:unnamed protein product [Euphydryas editha]|uniref:Uncharacterized protein n=1 Tax=Euphydryas editha TaxID=104508 RepID=A0AAU9U794_EUPED|nr:unnamed protein product [Euphydryas editha]